MEHQDAPAQGDPSSGWDRLLDLVDHLCADPSIRLDRDVEQSFSRLLHVAAAEGFVDRELHLADTSRWLTGLVAGHHAVRDAHHDIDPVADLAVLRVVVTRWLHPARPR